ncbi:FLOT1 protein, partial [Sylvietta virens]|nr:FLOT1 protein [Sylvietta virens]
QEIYKDRQKFSDQVFRVASSDLVNMGISVVSYTLKDVHDEQLGTPGTHLGTAGDTWDTSETHSGHTWDTLGDAWEQYRDTWDTLGYGCDTWGDLRHTWDVSGGYGVAQSLPNGFVTCPGVPGVTCPLSPQAARSQQAITAQRGEVALVERAQRVQLQEQEIGRRLQELEATVRKPAEAERYRLERLAEAQR